MPAKTERTTNGKLDVDNEADLIVSAETVHTKPLWKQMKRLNPPLPNPQCVPHIWRYDDIRPTLLRAGDLVPEQQAERRVLMLINPARGALRRPWKGDEADLELQMLHTQQTPCTLDCSLSCLMRRLEPIDTLLLLCVS